MRSRTAVAFVLLLLKSLWSVKSLALLSPVTFSNRKESSVRSSSAYSRMPTIQETETSDRDACDTAFSFDVECDFDPPSLLSNQHFQTIGGFLCRKKNIGSYIDRNDRWALPRLLFQYFTTPNKTDEPDFWDSRERINTPDGDWFHADTKYSNGDFGSDEVPTVLILHGLESNSDSMLTKEMAHLVTSELKMHCTCLNFRGCSGEPNDTIGAYHLGFTDDLHHFLEQRRQQGVTAPVYLTGFSLGANAILKCLGELGDDAKSKYNIGGGVALCAPLDQERNSMFLAQPGINRLVYTNFLLKSLKQKAVYQLERFCGNDPATSLFDYPRAIDSETIIDFDDAFLAPIYGYKDCWEYYRKTSSIHFVDSISVPTLIINAKDDPYMDPDVFFAEKQSVPVQMVTMPHGGHLGFCFHQTTRPIPPRSSWLTNELVRFLRHVHSNGRSRVGADVEPAVSSTQKSCDSST